MPEKTVQIVFRGTPDYKQRLKQAALDRRTNMQDLIGSAVAAYIKTSEAASQGPKLQGFDETDLTVTAKNADHKRILTAVEMLLDDPDICPVHRPILEALLAPELEELEH